MMRRFVEQASMAFSRAPGITSVARHLPGWLQSGHLRSAVTARTLRAVAAAPVSSGVTTDAQAGAPPATRLVTFRKSPADRPAVGLVDGSSVHVLAAEYGDMASVIAQWDLVEKNLRVGTGLSSSVPLAAVELLAPLPRPRGAIMCIGKNYREHVKEVDTWKTAPGITAPDVPQHPIVFSKAPQSVVGPGTAIRVPKGSGMLVDYEAELAVVIGRAGRGIPAARAWEHVFGYTIINDVTARDLQKKHQQWFLGKSQDSFCPMGPWLVPAEELPGVRGEGVRIQCWVNGEKRQDGTTGDMIFGIPELIEAISSGITLQPGDIIATGTPAGVGAGFNPPRFLKQGDVVKISIEGIGDLTNPVEEN